MKLYWARPTASLAVLILANELEISIDLVAVDAQTHRTRDGRWLSEISPKNCLPVVERNDGSILTETAVILGWLAAQDKDLRFTAPAHSEAYLRIQEWMVYFATEQHKLATLLFWDIDDQAKAAIRDRVIQRFVLVENALATTRFLIGNRCTIADLYLLVMVRGSRLLFGAAFEPQLQSPHLHAWFERMIARPAVRKSIEHHDQMLA